MPHQDEQQCLDSERLNFKDPDVVFVANLGGRGLGVKSDQYWVRYKAKNSYGAYIQGNMFCKKSSETKLWERDPEDETHRVAQVRFTLYDIEIAAMNACASGTCQ